MMSHRMVHVLAAVGLLWLLNACGVAEGPAFLRIEGSVSDQGGGPVIGREIMVKFKPDDLNLPEKNSQSMRTNENGQFVVEKSRFAGGLFIIPMALVVAPISGLVAAVTPWTFREVYEFFSPAYFIGSHCLPHPSEITVVMGSGEPVKTFSGQEIEGQLYRGKDFSKGKPCTRVYGLGELKIASALTVQ